MTSGCASCRRHASGSQPARLLNNRTCVSNLEHVPLADCDAQVLVDGGMCGNLRAQRADLALKRLNLLPQRCCMLRGFTVIQAQ